MCPLMIEMETFNIYKRNVIFDVTSDDKLTGRVLK